MGLTFIGPGIVMYFYSKTNEMHHCIKLFFYCGNTTCFGRSFRPSSGVTDCTYSDRHMANRYFHLVPACKLFDMCLLLYVQALTPDDGRKDRLKHVECYCNKISLRY